MQAKTILFEGVNEVDVDFAGLPDPGPGEVLIQSHYTCVSPGTELRCLAGEQPDAPAWPFIPGYALAGTVVGQGPESVVAVGTRVVCSGTKRADRAIQWGGHIGHAVCSEETLFPVAQGVDLLNAAMAASGATAYHGVRLARPALHEKVAVIGLGPIGQLSLKLYSMLGVHVVGCDRLPARVELAQAAGHSAVLVENGLADSVKAHFPQGADIVVDATGAPAAFSDAISVARELAWDDEPTLGARYVIQGSYVDVMPIPYQSAFRKELTFLTPRNYQPRDLRAVLDMLGRGKLDLRDLVSVVRTPAEAPQTYAQLQTRDPALMTAAFQWL